MLALAYLPILGNGQDGALPPTVVQNAPGIQGNVAWTRAQRGAELEQAAAVARQKKAVMESMLTQVQRPPVITSAEQYLAVYRPTAPRTPQGSGPSPEEVRSNAYVPSFENSASRTGSGQVTTTPAASPDLPQKKGGLFSLFKAKEKEPEMVPDLLPPPSSYPEHQVEESPNTLSHRETSSSIEPATQGGAEPGKSSIFGKLFSREKSASPSLADRQTLSSPATESPSGIGMSSVPPASDAPVTSGDPVGIPDSPSFDAPAAPARAATGAETPGEDGNAPIFSRRSAATGGGPSASVLSPTQATVGGVLVRLYEGTQITVLERSGSMARIRLADGREGTIAVSALSR